MSDFLEEQQQKHENRADDHHDLYGNMLTRLQEMVSGLAEYEGYITEREVMAVQQIAVQALAVSNEAQRALYEQQEAEIYKTKRRAQRAEEQGQ